MDEPKHIGELFDKLMSSSAYEFPEKGKIHVSSKQGVYVIFDPYDMVLHVGRTKKVNEGLNRRLYNHLTNGSSFSKQYLNKNGKVLRDGYKFKFLEEEDARTRALLEALTSGLLCPKHFGTG